MNAECKYIGLICANTRLFFRYKGSFADTWDSFADKQSYFIETQGQSMDIQSSFAQTLAISFWEALFVLGEAIAII